jgi:hypothetical protein
VDVLEAGIAALREGTQKVQRRRRLAVGHLLTCRVGDARLLVEIDAVDDVAAVAGQCDAILRLDVGRARLGELASNAADLHDGLRTGEGQNHRHLEEHAEEVADVVRAMLREALGAIAALEKKCVTGSHARKLLLQLARLTCKNEWRIGGERTLRGRQRCGIRILRNLLDGHASPGVRGPLGHCRT